MAEIVWTLEAARCLEDIHDYIATDNSAAAHKVMSGIYGKIQLLRDHPRLGQRYEPIVDREVREKLYGHYRIAYLGIEKPSLRSGRSKIVQATQTRRVRENLVRRLYARTPSLFVRRAKRW